MLRADMKLPAAILLLGGAMSAAALAAPPRIAVVRIADIYKSLDRTKTEQEGIDAEVQGVLKDRRVTELTKLLTTLKQQYTTLPQPVDDASRAKVREYAMKYREAETLQEDYASFREDQTKRINGKKVQETHANLDAILAAARKIGKDEGFDWVLDISGETNTTTPFVLYVKAPVDISQRVLTALQPNATLRTGATSSASAPDSGPAGEQGDSKH